MPSSLTTQGDFLPLAEMEVVKKYMLIISLHKKQKWLSYGAYAPLRQPRLSPLCGCECKLIRNVCFSTFLVAENKILFPKPFGYNETGIYTANIQSRFVEQNEKVIKMVLNGGKFITFDYKRFHFFKSQTRIEKIFFEIWDKYKNKNDFEIETEIRKDIDCFAKNNIKIIDGDIILNKYL